MALEISQTVTPLQPQTVPTPLLQQKAVLQSIPIPKESPTSNIDAGICPSLPRASKWESTIKSMNPKETIFMPLYLYCKLSVPFRVSQVSSPNSAAERSLGAQPMLFRKYKIPKGSPPPILMSVQIMAPAELPARMTDSLTTLALTALRSGPAVPSSLSQALRCLNQSPPLKKMISASSMILRLAFPSGVDRFPWVLKLSRWMVRCFGAIPYSMKILQQQRLTSSSTEQVQLPACSLQAAEVATATLGHLVVSQFQSQLLGCGVLEGTNFASQLKTRAYFQQVSPPMRKSLGAKGAPAARTRKMATIQMQFVLYISKKARY